MTIELGWWMLPLAASVVLVVWSIIPYRPSGGSYGSALGNAVVQSFMGLIWLALVLATWIAYLVTALVFGIR